MSDDKARVFQLRLTPLRDPDGVPVEVRLRRSLKYLLRSAHLRCLSVLEEQPEHDLAGGDREHVAGEPTP